MTKTTPMFEHQTCTRCGGCGQYSYNQVDGSTCYGCSGTGVQLTKRGKVAQAFYNTLSEVRLDSLKVGDVMQVRDMRGSYFARIVEVAPEGGSKRLDPKTGEWHPMYAVTTEHAKYGKSGLHADASTIVRKGNTAEEKAEKRAIALAYQAILTKTGQARKRA
jgi:hypothetical protein